MMNTEAILACWMDVNEARRMPKFVRSYLACLQMVYARHLERLPRDMYASTSAVVRLMLYASLPNPSPREDPFGDTVLRKIWVDYLGVGQPAQVQLC